MRQHRHGAVGEVDAGPAQPGFGVECRPWPHIPAHIGDVDLKLGVAVREFTHQHGIVEVARCLAIDGDDGQAAKVFAYIEVFGGQGSDGLLRLLGGFGQHCRWKRMRQMVLANNDLDIDAEGIRRTKHLDQASARRPAGRGETRNLDIDRQTFERPLRINIAAAILAVAVAFLVVIPEGNLLLAPATTPFQGLLPRLFPQHSVGRIDRRSHNLRAPQESQSSR